MRKSIQLLACMFFVASLITTGCASTQKAKLERNKALVHRYNDEIWIKGNLQILEEFCSAEIVQHFLPIGSDTKGLEELRKQIRIHRKAFPDWAEEIKRIVAEGDLVVTHFVSTGTNEGSFSGNPPTGKQIHINEMSFYRIVDGRIVEQWLIPDLLNLNQQLGLIGKPK